MIGYHLSRVAQKELKAKAYKKAGMLASTQPTGKKRAKKAMGGSAATGSSVEKNPSPEANTYSASMAQRLASLPSMAATMARSNTEECAKGPGRGWCRVL